MISQKKLNSWRREALMLKRYVYKLDLNNTSIPVLEKLPSITLCNRVLELTQHLTDINLLNKGK